MEFLLDITPAGLERHVRQNAEKREAPLTDEEVAATVREQREKAISIVQNAMGVSLSQQRFGLGFTGMVSLNGKLLDSFESLISGIYVEDGAITLLLEGGGVLKVRM